jgi:putative transposase
MINVSKKLVKIDTNGTIKMAPSFFGKDNIIAIGKKEQRRMKKNNFLLAIEHDCKVVKQHNLYYLIIPTSVPLPPKNIKATSTTRIVGVDPGVRTFMTAYDCNGVLEIHHDSKLVKALHHKIHLLKEVRTSGSPRRNKRNRHRKRTILKYERRLTNKVDELHWQTIHTLLCNYDVVMYGDIKSHGIVKGGKNPVLNRNMNALKFYQFKQRLLYKASTIEGKVVIPVNEAYTSQTCSSCGSRYKPGASKVYHCTSCNAIFDRDVNAAKNILMKGILTSHVDAS